MIANIVIIVVIIAIIINLFALFFGGFTLTFHIQVSRTLSKQKAFSPDLIFVCLLFMSVIAIIVVVVAAVVGGIHVKLNVLTSSDLGIFVSSPLLNISLDIECIICHFKLQLSLRRPFN
jgi:hypothetical protein